MSYLLRCFYSFNPRGEVRQGKPRAVSLARCIIAGAIFVFCARLICVEHNTNTSSRAWENHTHRRVNKLVEASTAQREWNIKIHDSHQQVCLLLIIHCVSARVNAILLRVITITQWSSMLLSELLVLKNILYENKEFWAKNRSRGSIC